MPVYDRSYRRWDGELSRRPLRFIPIAATGIRQALGFRAGWFLTLLYRLLLLASLIPFLLFLLLNYAVSYRPDFLPKAMLGWFDTIEPFRFIQYPLLMRMNIFFLMAFTVIVGSGLISRDRAAGAMPLYLSRPLTRSDYVLGKFCVLAWFLASLTILPCLALWIFGVISSPQPDALARMLPDLPRILIHGGVIVLTYSSTMLAVSSLCRRPMFAGLLWFGLIIFLPTFLSIATARFQWTSIPAASPNDAFEAIGFDVWGLERLKSGPDIPREVQGMMHVLKIFPDTPVEWCWISVAAWTLASLALLTSVMRRQDVVTDSAR